MCRDSDRALCCGFLLLSRTLPVAPASVTLSVACAVCNANAQTEANVFSLFQSDFEKGKRIFPTFQA